MGQSEVLIVGGGVIGAACAYALTSRGVAVTMVETGPLPGSASLAAAGMLAPLAESGPDDPLLGLGVRARDYYADLAPELLERSGIDIELRNDGILKVAFTEEEVTELRGGLAWQRQSGFSAEWLSADELHEFAPGIAPDALGAAFAPEDGAVNPLALLQALKKGAEAGGAVMVRGEAVERLLIENGRIQGVQTSTGARGTDAVVIAGGAWSGKLGGLPKPLSVQPIRGQIAATVWPENCSKVIVYGADGYVLPQAGGAIAGSTMENVGFDVSVTDAGLDHIRAVVRHILPTLGYVLFSRTWVGLRPCTPDGRPIIGEDPDVSGLWYATGHGRNGILLAGYTGELLASLHAGDIVEVDLSSIAPGRFWTW